MRYITFLLTSLLCTGITSAQTWVDLIEGNDATVQEVKEAFEAHWGNKSYERGKGYKQFKRWEDFMEARTYPSGQRLNGRILLEALEEKNQIPKAKSNSPWQAVGPTAWTSIAWNPGLGRVNTVAVDPIDENKVYLGTPAGGIWRSLDGGGNWEPLSDKLTSIGVSGIAINPNNTDEIYIATGDGNGGDTYSIGVLKSIDGGSTWTTTALVHEVSSLLRCRRILMDPNDDQKLFVASNSGLYISKNGGNSWILAIAESLRDVELHPNNSDIVYASGRKVFRSEDGGESFSQVNSGLPASGDVNRLEMTVTPSEPNLLYVVAGSQENSGFYGFYMSENSGQDFELVSNSPNILSYPIQGDGEGGQSWYDLAIAASPSNPYTVLVGGINVWRSSNNGFQWEIKSHWVWPASVGYTHADIHWLHYHGNTLWCGSDGGIFKSTDNGTNWIDLSAGLQITQYYRIAVSQTDPELILTASQDNGTNLFANDGSYLHLLGGDGNGAEIDYSNDDIMYSAYPGGEFQRSTNGGQNFDSFTQGFDENGAWVTPFALHPTQSNICYAALENVWKREGENEWEKISDFSFGTTLRAMRLAPSDPNTIYTSSFSTLLKTNNGGGQWTNISQQLPNLFIRDIEVDPLNPERIWVCMSGYNAGQKVYHSPDGGLSWENVSFNLPNTPVNCLSYQAGTEDGLYIGTDIGIFYKDATNFNWTPFDEGLPNVVVNQIYLHYPSSQLLAATYGRGVWKNEFFDPSVVQPIAQLSPQFQTICMGDSVSFSNLSVNAIGAPSWSFPGGMPSESSDLNPMVTYALPGVYPVELNSSNMNGSDVLVLNNAITVLDTLGVAVPFEEGFEASANTEALGWYPVGNESELRWKVASHTGYDSGQSLWVENYGGPAMYTYLIQSQTYDLTALDTALLSMRVAYAGTGSTGLETLRIYTSSDCGENWSFKKVLTSSNSLPTAPSQLSFFAPQGPQDWQWVVIDNIQPQERSAQFRIQLRFNSSGGNNVYVDNINIGSDLSVDTSKEDEVDTFHLFPNPATDFVQVHLVQKKPGSLDLELLDIAGRKVKSERFESLGGGAHELRFDTSHLPKGAYLLRATSPDGEMARPLIIQ